MMTPEIEHLTILITRSYYKGAWHGPSVKEAIEGINTEEAHKRIPGTHSIIELVAHMAAWRMFVTRRLQGDAAYEVTDEMNFPASTDWQKTVDDLETQHTNMMAALKAFPASKLFDVVANSSYNYSFYILLHGIVHHDLYHAGQIMLIRKAAV